MKIFPLFILFSFLFISLNCLFQYSLFKEINSKRKKDNFIVSPLSLFQVLSLAANGAKDITQEEMLSALEIDDLKTLNSINLEILKSLKSFTTLEMANALMTRIPTTEEFSEISEEYCAPAQLLESAEQVNNWCNEKTHGKIKEIVNELKNDTMMILLNAIYFKAKWYEEFSKSNTKPKDFYNYGNETIKVDTMSGKIYTFYYEDDRVQIVDLFFNGDDWASAVIVLPKESEDINDYINSLNKNKNHLLNCVDKIMESREQNVLLELPKFEISGDIALNDILKDLGLVTAFTKSADFTGINKDIPIKIDEILQKTYLKVYEEGTDAAAASKINYAYEGEDSHWGEIHEMKVNRPFLFLIKTNKLPKDNNMLFMAKIEKL